jgi:hypothetical protein
MIVTPQIAAMILAGAAQDFRMVQIALKQDFSVAGCLLFYNPWLLKVRFLLNVDEVFERMALRDHTDFKFLRRALG